MTNSDDKHLKSFLQRHQPVPRSQTDQEIEVSLNRIEPLVTPPLGRGFKLRSLKPTLNAWFGVSSFLAATLAAVLLTARHIEESSRSNSNPTLVFAEFESGDGASEFNEDAAEALEVGSEWLELVSAY